MCWDFFLGSALCERQHKNTVLNMTTDEHLLVSIVTLRILAWFCLHFAQSTVPVSAASTELLTC